MGLRSAPLPARLPARSSATPLRLTRGAAFALGLCLCACATIEHGLSVAQVAGRTLSTRGGEGSRRLQSEVEVDVTIRDFVSANGRPDYLHVVDRMSLYFFYVRDDRAVKFERDLLPPSEAHVLGRIPGSLLKLLPKREVDALLARRAAVQRRHAAIDRARRRAAPRPAPAAPDPNRLLSRFDVRAIVGRMRLPLSAADPGVGGWQAVRFSDGVAGSTARRGGMRYEVRSDRVVVAMPISGSRTTPPTQARIEVHRVHSAVFGAHAKAVTEHVMGMVRRVAADRSGRSRAAQRIRGRMVRVDRVPRSGQLVYAVHP